MSILDPAIAELLQRIVVIRWRRTSSCSRPWATRHNTLGMGADVPSEPMAAPVEEEEGSLVNGT